MYLPTYTVKNRVHRVAVGRPSFPGRSSIELRETKVWEESSGTTLWRGEIFKGGGGVKGTTGGVRINRELVWRGKRGLYREPN